MAEIQSLKSLRVALFLVGIIFIVGIYALVIIWPSGWAWHSGMSHSLPHYLQMILGVYATLGVFLVIASRDPLKHLSLIWFTIWSSVVHAGIMAAQSLANPEHRGTSLGRCAGTVRGSGDIGGADAAAYRVECAGVMLRTG